ncbi:MAG: hypothetical protein A3F74_24050 [Betaproteobacteria bacterium RIFCSPLOWO2_12_FULL_62_58]|nr:MAG: hypothetical protein A3F74_24050 [Betaproteobacteria bacterium RIFCSPLOWO2_12_FULL_62_58]
MNHDHRHEPDGGKETKSRTKWVFIGFALIAAYFLITEHRAHLSRWLSSYGIWLLLLACPLLHLFMHGGHGGHGGHGSHRDDSGEASDKQRKGQDK